MSDSSDSEQRAFRAFMDDLQSGRLSYEEARRRYLQLGEAIRRRYQQEITALSVDIVQSLQRKSSDELDGQLTFDAYHRWVERIFAEFHCEREFTWAGDGGLAVFKQPEAAVSAARALLDRLPDFNARYNRLPRPMQMRIGVHTGAILTDETAGLAEIASPTFDVAAHLQEAALPNQMLVSEATFRQLPEAQRSLMAASSGKAAGVVCFAYPAQASGDEGSLRMPGADIRSHSALSSSAFPSAEGRSGAASIPGWAWVLAIVGLIAACAGLTALALAFMAPRPAADARVEIVPEAGGGMRSGSATQAGQLLPNQPASGNGGVAPGPVASPSPGAFPPGNPSPASNSNPQTAREPSSDASGAPVSQADAWEPATQPWRSPDASAPVPPQVVPSGPENKWVLAIGVDSAGSRNSAAASLAEAVAEAFRHSAGVPPEHVRVLANELATSDGVKQGFKWLQEQASSGRDTIYVYLIGPSGVVAGEPAFLPYPSPGRSAPGGPIAGTHLMQWLAATRAQAVLLVADTASPLVLDAPRDADMGRRLGILGVSGSHPGQTQTAGMVAPVLLAGLRGHADADRDRKVSLTELLQFAGRELPRQTKGARQLYLQSGFGGGMPDLWFSVLR